MFVTQECFAEDNMPRYKGMCLPFNVINLYYEENSPLFIFIFLVICLVVKFQISLEIRKLTKCY